VREAPGGKDNLSNFWDAEEGTPAFKPTRRYVVTHPSNTRLTTNHDRVREIPGGHDSVGDVSACVLIDCKFTNGYVQLF